MAYNEKKQLLYDVLYKTDQISGIYLTINIYGLSFLEDNQRSSWDRKAAYKCTGSHIVERLNVIQQSGCSKESAAEQLVDEIYEHVAKYLYSFREQAVIQWLDALSDVYKFGVENVNDHCSLVPSTSLRQQLMSFQLGDIIREERQAIEESIDSSL